MRTPKPGINSSHMSSCPVAGDFMPATSPRRTRGEMQRKIDKELSDWQDRPIGSITRSEIKERAAQSNHAPPERLGLLT
jgi:hypothetical protein